jgi:3-oxoacyl-[acyl-carrier protein] reductase
MIKFDLANKVAIITGGAQGFGFAMSERFIQSGAKVIMWDIDEGAAKKAKKKLTLKI